MPADQTAGIKRGPLVMIGLVCGPFVSMVDSNAVNVAIPGIAREMNSAVSTAGWIVSAYLLGIGILLPAAAWLARRFGTRRVYLIALAAFAVASAACAAAPSIQTLIALRAVQGLASAPLIPLALALIFDGDSGKRGRPPVLAGMFFFLAPALGPSVGGLLVATVGWRWIFLINVPLIALGLLGARRLPADATDPERRPLDFAGLLLIGLGATGVILGASLITSGTETGTGWPWPVALLGLVLLAGYAARQRRIAHPALSLRLLEDAHSRLPVLVSVIASIVLFAVLFLIPVFLLEVQGRSPLVAGLVLFPQGIVMGLCTGVGERLVSSIGFRATVGGGMLILAISTALLLLTSATTPPWLLALLLAGRGMALGLTLQPIVVGMLEQLPRGGVADVSTLFNVVQRLAGSLGVAGFAAFYQLRASSAGTVHSAAAFHDTVWLMTGLALAGAALAVFLPGRAPATTVAEPVPTVP